MVMTVKAVLIRLLSVVCTTTIKLNCQFLKKPGMFKKRNSLELIIRSLENTLALPLNTFMKTIYAFKERGESSAGLANINISKVKCSVITI